MLSISSLYSDRSYKSPILLGVTAFSIAILLRRSHSYHQKTRLMETLRNDFAFHAIPTIKVTSSELSEIAKMTLQKGHFRANISQKKPFQDPSLPLSLSKTINRLAKEIMDYTKAPSIEMVLDIGYDSLVGWHVDNINDTTPPISNVRFVSTLRGPATRFAQLSFKDRCLFKNIYKKNYQITNRENGSDQTAKESGINSSNTFYAKIGQVIAFCSEDPNGAVHAGPLSLDTNRVRLIFDLPR